MNIGGTAWRGLGLALGVLLCTGACARAATVTEFDEGISLGSNPNEIAAGPDGNMWFTEPGTDQIGRITPAGVVTEFSDGISPGSRPLGITSGPDGNLWFTEFDARRIGRITPQGVVTEFSEGISPGSNPRAIVSGADGNLWYTDTNGRRIGRITPDGVVTEFDVNRGSGGGPQAITAGPDGNLWFTELPNGLVRITPAGVVTRFANFSGPHGIAAGPDGNLWTTEHHGSIRRITTDGVVTGAFPLTDRSTSTGITSGPDGNLWFADGGDDAIGRITPSGQIILVTAGISDGSFPRGIAAGPDGNLWFTEPGTDQIGRITPAIEPPVVAAADASAISATSATLHGMVDGRSLTTAVRFEYGVSETYGSQTAEQTVAMPSEQAVSAALTNLQPSTSYRYRLIATSGGGSASADRTFTTAAAPQPQPQPTAPPPPPPPPPPLPPPACSNGIDDDRDGFADGADPRCHSDADRRNAGSYQSQGATESPVDDPVLACSSSGLALVSAELTNRRERIRLRGIAGPGLAGRQVGLYANGRRAASARVQPDGSFAVTFKASRRAPGAVRYQARLGARRSQSVVAQRHLADIRLALTAGRVKLTGRSLARRPRTVELLGRAGGCGSFERLATVRVPAGGRFTLSATAFAKVDIAAYRVRMGATGSAGPRESTPPRALVLR